MLAYDLPAKAATEVCEIQIEQQRNFAKAQQELQSLTARYRGPLLEAVVDLENRLWHLANATSEWQTSEGESFMLTFRVMSACDDTTALYRMDLQAMPLA